MCVVGAGPAGLVVAHRLRQAGQACLVVERLASEALCQKAKAGMIEDRTVRALAPFGLQAPITAHGGRNGLVEIRVSGAPRLFDYGMLAGQGGHYVYPQHFLVRAWVDGFTREGGRVLFGTEVVRVEPLVAGSAGYRGAASDLEALNAGARVHVRAADGSSASIRCRAVVLAGGAGSSLGPLEGTTRHEHTHPFRWLTAMIGVPPLGERTIYAVHERGFAAHLRRSPELTRFYLQTPAAEGAEQWPDERMRAELALRLGVSDGARLQGPMLERDTMTLRVRVCEPMQSGCQFLVGDAAHLITPAGGKGMNLAIADALELSEGLLAWLERGEPERLQGYSAARLPDIWQAQEFSNWMLSMFCGGVLNLREAEPDPGRGFARGLHRAQVERLFSEPDFARWFARHYAGALPA